MGARWAQNGPGGRTCYLSDIATKETEPGWLPAYHGDLGSLAAGSVRRCASEFVISHVAKPCVRSSSLLSCFPCRPALPPPAPLSEASSRSQILSSWGEGGTLASLRAAAPGDGCDLESAHQVCQHPARPASVLGSDSLVPTGQLGTWTQGGHVGEGPRPRALGCLLAHTPNPPSLRPRHKA